jgi:hypothetical protein
MGSFPRRRRVHVSSFDRDAGLGGPDTRDTFETVPGSATGVIVKAGQSTLRAA